MQIYVQVEYRPETISIPQNVSINCIEKTDEDRVFAVPSNCSSMSQYIWQKVEQIQSQGLVADTPKKETMNLIWQWDGHPDRWWEGNKICPLHLGGNP